MPGKRRDSIPTRHFKQVNKRSDREYQITLELTPLDDVLSKARDTADELAASRADDLSAGIAAN